MSEQFAFSDLRRVQWLATLKLTLARGFCAGIVFAILFLLGPDPWPVTKVLAVPFAWAVVAVPFALIIQVAGIVFGAIIPLMGLFFHFVGSLVVCVGDPIVYLINRSLPRLLDVADFGFFNFQPMIFITNPD